MLWHPFFFFLEILRLTTESNLVFRNWVDTVDWLPLGDSKVDVSSVSPSEELRRRVSELFFCQISWGVE